MVLAMIINIYDSKRQGILERKGIQFIRFTNDEIKKELFSVLLALETKIEEIIQKKQS